MHDDLYEDVLWEAARLADIREKWSVPIQSAVRAGIAGPDDYTYFRHRIRVSELPLYYENAAIYRNVVCAPSDTISTCLGVKLTDTLEELDTAFRMVAEVHDVSKDWQEVIVREFREIAALPFVRRHSAGGVSTLQALATHAVSPAQYKLYTSPALEDPRGL